MSHNQGYILLHRKIIDSAIWSKPPLYLKVFSHILCKANHKDFEIKLDTGELLLIRRGQAFTSYRHISEDIKYRENKQWISPSEGEIRYIVNFLKRTGTITTTATGNGLLITFVNYNKYQSITTGTPTGSLSEKQQDSNPTTTTNNNDNNDKENTHISCADICQLLQDKTGATTNEKQIAFLINKYSEEKVSYQVNNIPKDVGSPIAWLKSALKENYSHSQKKTSENAKTPIYKKSPCCDVDIFEKNENKYCAKCLCRIIKTDSGELQKTDETVHGGI
ncbi:MAG: hypothetical protein A3J83_03270 [Elusimicrobia bacterium RIFOXYA2_FULL_40_6]|nr:MAG: hypothetical protein A3J83_03270 [Elusimicrobia bacterium RIFOXYA2_FULL_40_6]